MVDPGRLVSFSLLSSFIFPPVVLQPHLKFPNAFLTIIGNDLLFMLLQICCKWQFWTVYHTRAFLCVTFEALHFICNPLPLSLLSWPHCIRIHIHTSSVPRIHIPYDFIIILLISHSTCSVLGIASILLLSNISYHLKALNLYIKQQLFICWPAHHQLLTLKFSPPLPNLHILCFLIWICYIKYILI